MKAVSTNDCWYYAGFLNKDGYGIVSLPRTAGMARTSGTAHRVMYEAVFGPIPEGLELDHLCRVTTCINPEHLEPVTRQENNYRMNGPGLCKRGHKVTGDNVYRLKKEGKVYSRCKTCTIKRIAARKLRRAE